MGRLPIFSAVLVLSWVTVSLPGGGNALAAEGRAGWIDRLAQRAHRLTAVKKLGHRIDLYFGQGRSVGQNVMDLFKAIPTIARAGLTAKLGQAAHDADRSKTSPILLRQPSGLGRLFSASPTKVLTFEHGGDAYTIAMGPVAADRKNPGRVKQKVAVINTSTSGGSREVTVYSRTATPPSWLPRALYNRLPEGLWSEPTAEVTGRAQRSGGEATGGTGATSSTDPHLLRDHGYQVISKAIAAQQAQKN